MVELKNTIQNTFKALGSHQKLKYVVSKTIPYVAEKIGQCMEKAKLLPCLSSDEQELNLLKEVQKGMEGNFSGTMVHHMLDILHEQVIVGKKFYKIKKQIYVTSYFRAVIAYMPLTLSAV